MSVIEKTPREQWRSESESVGRGDLLDLITVALRQPLRTWSEQQALLIAIDRIDYPAMVRTDDLRQQATENWKRAHRCDCGTVSAGYWCSEECQRQQDGPYSGDDDL